MSVKRAREIIANIDYITIASVTEDGMPWNSPVFSGYDEAYNFYFGTHIDSQKAKNIKANPNVFLVIYDSTVPPGTGEGVYVKGHAHQVNDTDFWDFAAVQGDGPIRLYKVAPEQVWMNSGDKKNGHYIDTREEIQL